MGREISETSFIMKIEKSQFNQIGTSDQGLQYDRLGFKVPTIHTDFLIFSEDSMICPAHCIITESFLHTW